MPRREAGLDLLRRSMSGCGGHDRATAKCGQKGGTSNARLHYCHDWVDGRTLPLNPLPYTCTFGFLYAHFQSFSLEWMDDGRIDGWMDSLLQSTNKKMHDELTDG